jgi:hypothetical protein
MVLSRLVCARAGRIGDRGLLVSLPRVQGPAGRPRSQSPGLGRQGHRAARPAPRARGPPSRGRAGEKLRAADRALLAAAACQLPRSSRGARLVSPRTLLRWHRALVRRSGGSRPADEDARPCRPTYGSWCWGWHGRIRAGGIGESAASSPNSACGCRHRPSGGCSPAPDWDRLYGGQVRAGASSCAPRRRASSPAPPRRPHRERRERAVSCRNLNGAQHNPTRAVTPQRAAGCNAALWRGRCARASPATSATRCR